MRVSNMAVCSEVRYPPPSSPTIRSLLQTIWPVGEFLGFVRSHSQQRPLLALPCEDKCGTTPTRVLRKKSHVSAVIAGTQGPGAMESVDPASHSSSSLYLLELLTRVDGTT
jgi:hypothetical protein